MSYRLWGYHWVILGMYRDTGKENGNCYRDSIIWGLYSDYMSYSLNS